MDPPDNALVLSVDEKTEIQALDRTQPMSGYFPEADIYQNQRVYYFHKVIKNLLEMLKE